MDFTIFFTVVGAVVTIIGSNIALISWLRNDMKTFESDIRADMRSFEIEVRGWKDEINKEMKDFHGRLCVMNERIKHPLKEEKKGK